MVDAGKPIITITGISGFLGSRVCLDFLKTGEFRVRGTVRDSKNEAKLAPLRKAFGEYFDQLELVDADLLNTEQITKAIAGSTYVVHTASPFAWPENEDEVVKPAVDGTIAVMKACSAAGVKRCVITSSCASIAAMAATDKPDPEIGFYDENCWSNPERPEGLASYVKSKTLAEKAAWDYQQSLPEGERFEIVVINPTFIQGPTLIPGGFISSDFIENLLTGKTTECDADPYGIVDVRDVSKMHLEGLRKPEAANQRFIAYSERVHEIEIAQALAAEFGPLGYTLPTKVAQGQVEKDARFSNAKAKAMFDIEFISAKDACIAMAHSLIELGRIQPPK